MITVPVTCTLSDQNGDPVAGGVITAELNQTEIYQGIVVPEKFTATADASGIATLNLWPNELGVNGSMYTISATNPDTNKRFLKKITVTVPNSPCNLHDIITSTPFPAIDASQQALAAAQGALALVTAQAGIATAKAALTAADVVLTHADVVTTNADVLLTSADVALTHADIAMTNADAVLTDADAAQTALDRIATAADRVQTGLDATSATASAGTATTQAGSATTSAGIATTQAGIATDKAVLTAADAVATADDRVAVESVVDVYLGASATNHTARLDATALQNGDIYFNTSTHRMMAYASGTWYATETAGATDAALVSYTPAGAGAVATTVQAELQMSVNAKRFGAVGNGIADDTTAIQAAINAAIYNGGSSSNGLKAVVHLPAGVYLCSGPLHLGYGTSFSSVTLQGDGIRYNAEDGFGGTAIVFTHNNAPGIAVQGSRFPIIRDMTIKGANAAYILANNRGTAAGSDADLIAANWVDTAFPAASSSRYAVYAGIAIDPYSGTRPATSYPDVTYPAFLGAVSQYGKNYSSAVSIENVQIIGFVVGVAVQPCDADGNGDYTKLNKVAISSCQYGFSVGNTQSRLAHLSDCQMAQVHTGIVTTKHGRQVGKPAILVESTEFGAIIKWVDVPNLSYGGAPKFISCYGEQIYSIGNSGANAAGCSSITFDQCEFAFQLQSYRGVPKYIFENNGPGFATFNGCAFSNSPASNYAFLAEFGAKTIGFRVCTTQFSATQLYEKFSLNATAGITISGLATNFNEFSVLPSTQWNLDTGSSTTVETVGFSNTGIRTKNLPAVTKTIIRQPNKDGQLFSVNIVPYFCGKGGYTFSTSGRDVTVTTDLGSATWAMMQRGMGVGDMVWDSDTGITFRIKSRSVNVFIMQAVSGYDSAGNLLSIVGTVGSLYLLNCRIYSPSFPVYCDTTNNNAVATNVNRGDDTAAFIDTEIAVNDYVSYIPYGDKLGGENRIQITARDGTARTITVNGEFKRTATFRPIQLFIRAEAPNA